MAGLFGGQRQPSSGVGLLERIALMGQAGLGGPSPQAAIRAREAEILAAQQARQQTAYQDRLRAMLSPADTAQGSGLGAAPSLENQEAAIADARLVNPAAAEMFSPVVAGQRRAQQAASLFGSDPLAQTLYGAGNEEFLKALGQQYAPQVVAPGSAQVVGGRRTIEQPTFGETGDTTVRRTSEGVAPVFTRTTPSISEGIAQQNANTTQSVGLGNLGVARDRLDLDTASAGTTLGPGQVRFGLDGQPVAQVQNAPSGAQADNLSAYNTNQTETIPTLNQMRASLASGDVITGLGADVQLQAQRALAAAGNQDAQRRVAATEAYRNMSGRLRVSMAKSLGANPSNADIALLERVTAGDIGQNAESLLATIDQGLQFANQRGDFLRGQSGQQQGGQGGSVSVSSPAQAQALAPGTRYRTPDGQEYIR